MKAKYEVLPIEGSDGIEFLGEPFPRHVYHAGEIIELDDKVHAVDGLLGRGQIRIARPDGHGKGEGT